MTVASGPPQDGGVLFITGTDTCDSKITVKNPFNAYVQLHII